MFFTKDRIKSPHDKTNKMACVPSKDRSAWASTQSDQGLPCALNRLHSDSKDSDQTGHMPRLISVFAACTSFCWFCCALAQFCIPHSNI